MIYLLCACSTFVFSRLGALESKRAGSAINSVFERYIPFPRTD